MRWNSLDVVGNFGQVMEEAGQLRIDPFTDGLIFREELAFVGAIKLLISSQIGQELGKRA